MPGAGKSSLLAAVLGELRGTSGRVKIQGSLAYVPQQPWVMSGTLRRNILFKKPVIAGIGISWLSSYYHIDALLAGIQAKARSFEIILPFQ